MNREIEVFYFTLVLFENWIAERSGNSHSRPEGQATVRERQDLIEK